WHPLPVRFRGPRRGPLAARTRRRPLRGVRRMAPGAQVAPDPRGQPPMTENDLPKKIAEAKCLGSLVAIDTAHKAGSLTDAEKDRLLDGLVPLHEDHNREVAELVRQVLAASEPAGPPLLHDWDFRNLAPGTLPGGW